MEIGELAYFREKKVEAIAWIRTHPREFAALSAQRIFHFWFQQGRSPLHTAVLGLFTIASWAGFLLLRKQNSVAFGMIAAIWIFFPLLYYFNQWVPAFRQPMEWTLFLSAGAALATAAQPRWTTSHIPERAMAARA